MYTRSILARLGLGVAFAGLALINGLAAAGPLDKLQGDSQWSGQYFYPDSDKPRAPVAFTLTLRVSADGSFSGRTEEPNTFGKQPAPRLYATVRGAINGSGVQFTKTYDGTGGVSHSVAYSGNVSSDGSSMSGSWRIKDYSGAFNLRLVQHTGGAARGSCITPGQMRTTDSFVYWNFRSSCDTDRLVSVCARYANGNNNILAVNVPARQSADINLGHTSLGQAKLSWKEGGGIPCP